MYVFKQLKSTSGAGAPPGAPCAQGATENESAYIFAETTWKMACAAISPAVRYKDHVPEYLLNGKWRNHPFILHRLKLSETNKIIKQLQKMYASPTIAHGPGAAPPAHGAGVAPPHSKIGVLGLVTRGAAEFHLVAELIVTGVFKM